VLSYYSGYMYFDLYGGQLSENVVILLREK